MKKLILLSSLSIVALQVQAKKIKSFTTVKQDQKLNKHLQYNSGLKVYNEASYKEFTSEQPYLTTLSLVNSRQTTDYLRPTVAYQWRNKKANFHEIELNRFNISKENTSSMITNFPSGQPLINSGGEIVATNIAMRYEYVLNFNKKRDSKLIPALGLGFSPYYDRQSLNPKTSYEYPQIYTEVGVKTFIIPRLSYYFHNRFFCDFNIPVCLTNFSSQQQNIKDPALSATAQKYEVINFELLPKILSARIGIGMKI